jgi:hypothetical protein
MSQGLVDDHGGTMMLRKTLLALAAIASIGLLAPDPASARGGFGGGHFGGGGFHGGGFGGFHGGGFHGGGFHGGGFYGRGFGYGLGAVGLGVGLGYGLYGPYGYYGGYPYYDGYYADEGGCYLVRRRILTPYGWRIRPVEICG